MNVKYVISNENNRKPSTETVQTPPVNGNKAKPPPLLTKIKPTLSSRKKKNASNENT